MATAQFPLGDRKRRFHLHFQQKLILNSNLFRKEVVKPDQERAQGSILLVYPLSNYLILSAAVLILLCLLMCSLLLSYTRHADTTGVVEPSEGIVKVFSPQAGLLKSTQIKEGQKVTKGQVLFIFATQSTDAGGKSVSLALDENVERQIANLHDELSNTKKLNAARLVALKNSLLSQKKEREILEDEINLRKKILQSAESMAERYDQLLKSGYAADALIRQKKDELLNQQINLQSLKKMAASNDSEQEKIKLELNGAPLQANLAEAQIKKAISKAEAELNQQKYRGEWSVLAPCDGVISAISMTVNQPAYGGILLATILPADSSLSVHLYAPSRSLGFIRMGQRVKMKLDAFPYQKFGVLEGTVSAISESATLPSELFSGNRLAASNLTGEALYTIRVSPNQDFISAYGKEYRLRAGMQLSAQVQLDTRLLFEWIFEPLYSLRSK